MNKFDVRTAWNGYIISFTGSYMGGGASWQEEVYTTKEALEDRISALIHSLKEVACQQ